MSSAATSGSDSTAPALPETMRAVRVVSFDGPAAVALEQVPTPTRGPGEVLVEVHAAGVAYPDVLQTRGQYQNRFELPFTLGSEFAGVVVEADAGSDFAPGDRVAGVLENGAFAEFVSAPEARVFPLPAIPGENSATNDATTGAGTGAARLDLVTAASMPINVLSAEWALARAGLRAGETVLVHGAAGGLGVALVQQAKLAGARVIAVTSTPEKAAIATAQGADETVAVEGFLDAVRSLTDGRGVDVVLDPVGGDRFTDSIRSLARGTGRVVVLGFTGGGIPTVKVNRLLLNNTTVVGSAWEGLMPSPMVDLRAQWSRLSGWIADGHLRPTLTAELPLEEAAAALTSLDERRAAGKLALRVR